MTTKNGRDIEIEVGYPEFEKALQRNFLKNTMSNKTLFKVKPKWDVTRDLWEDYISNLEEESRQQFNCNCCKSFIRKYGDIVIIDDDGLKKSVIWSLDGVPEYFQKAVQTLKDITEAAPIKEPFITNETLLGRPEFGGYGHLSVELMPNSVAINTSRLKAPHQVVADMKQEYKMLFEAVVKYDTATVDKGIALLKSGTVYRGEQLLNNLEWFKGAMTSKKALWTVVATAPTGFARIKSNVVGTLLDDIMDGLDNNTVVARLSSKLDPSIYMRSQVAPTVGNIEQAERIIGQLGLADSLRRRYARMDEIPEFLWKDRVKKAEPKTTGVFANIVPKQSARKKDVDESLPTTTMTWDKFSRTVLPGASSLSVKVDNPSRLMSLVTEAVENSEGIMKWNNPFSWYYHGGADAEMRKRVEAAGGRYENNDIRVSLMWDTYTDLDLHCRFGGKNRYGDHHIYYGNKISGAGYLDVDMNVGIQTLEPVENIRFNGAESGDFNFYVDNFTNRNDNNSFVAELEVNGKVYTTSKTIGNFNKEPLFKFKYNEDGTISNLVFDGATSNASQWGIETDEFINVKGIVKSPNVWGDNKSDFAHTFFLLDDIKDESEGKGRGFFNEMLRSDLYEIRKTLEAYSAASTIEEAEQADTFGIGFKDDSEWDLTVKVTEGGLTRLIKIDRFD